MTVERIEGAMDGEHAKQELISMIVAKAQQRKAESAVAQRKAATRLSAELEQLRVSQLQSRAVAQGVERSAVEQALDSDDPQQALQQLGGLIPDSTASGLEHKLPLPALARAYPEADLWLCPWSAAFSNRGVWSD